MKYIFIFLAFLSTSLASAQGSGRITYEEKMNLHKNLPPDRQEMKDMIPEFNTSMFSLTFNGDESIYQPQKESEESEVTSNSGGNQMQMRFGRENRIVYKNLALDTMIESREFMQKQFLIVGATTPRKWKIGKNQKEILGHKCMEADFRLDSATSMVVWFAPEIQVSNGPSDYQGLPGLILGVDINDGLRMITATEIKLADVDTSVIIAPTKGKEVTSEEFEKIRKEKMKEMHMNNPGGGPGGPGTMIMIRHN
ncbi:MAG: GLPGLI family protein [Saprospiraceae bacterium]|uniref:GLPGLI family protein n=1 Tax=Candidatus Opimibacter skivensis TaxID=2982028 RepID=A0A9D7T078_9BACT|nr:GLPGLI family protein [Candidatus Opimibacter skivensis]